MFRGLTTSRGGTYTCYALFYTTGTMRSAILTSSRKIYNSLTSGMSNIIILLTLITVAVLLLWLSNRAWRIKNVFLRWSGASLAGILATASLLVCLVAVIG